MEKLAKILTKLAKVTTVLSIVTILLTTITVKFIIPISRETHVMTFRNTGMGLLVIGNSNGTKTTLKEDGTVIIKNPNGEEIILEKKYTQEDVEHSYSGVNKIKNGKDVEMIKLDGKVIEFEIF